MDKNLSKDQVKVILQNAPKGSDYGLVIRSLENQGYIMEGYNEPIPEPPKTNIVKQLAQGIAQPVVQSLARTGQALGVGIAELSGNEELKNTAYSNIQKPMSDPILGTEVPGVKNFGEGGGQQIAGQALSMASLLFPFGKAAGIGTKIASTVLPKTASKIIGNVASGAAGGYLADTGYGLTEEKTLGEVFTPGVGTALGAAIPLIGPLARGASSVVKGNKTAEGVTKRIIQGQTKDLPLAEKAFSNIDTTGVKTRQELSERLSTAMEKQMDTVDAELAKDTRKLSLDDFAIRQENIAGQEVKTDVISNALNHLEEIYTKSGDDLMASNIKVIKDKAIKEGLTHQDVNNIARKYSEEFGVKAFNKVGDPLTSVNAQMFENTRSGLKQAARGGLGFGEEAKVADQIYSAMSNTKRLIDNGVEAVNKLEGRLQNRNILQKLSYGGAKLINTLTGGSLKSAVEALGVSNIGNKIDNWVALEKSLKKDLEFIRKANTLKTESALIKFINDTASKMKFPGDVLIDDVSAMGKKGGYSENLINQRRNSTTKNMIPKTSNIPKIIPKGTKPSSDLKGKGTIPKNSLLKRIKETLKDETGSAEVFTNKGSTLTTKILKDLEGKTTVSKQYILDATNRGELKQVERDVTRQVLEDMTRGSDNPLVQEARKYKSAEEFVNNSTELTYKNLQENPYSIKAYGKEFNEPVEYHRAGSIKKNGDIWLTDNPAGASQYSSAGGGTKTGSYIVQSKNPLIIDTAGGKYANGNIDINKILTKEEVAKGYTNNPTTKQKFIDYAKKNGYDAVQFADSFPDGEGGMRSLVVWDKSAIKTKSQLTDIWKKANKKAVELPKATSLEQEAKKYKSAEEFVKAQKPIYHGTASKFDKFDTSKMEGNVAYFTDSLNDFGKGNPSGAVGTKYKMERYIKPDLKLAGYDEADKYMTGQLEQMGYRGFKFEKGDSTWYEIWNPNEDLLTKSQLTDIWNKAQVKQGKAQLGLLPKVAGASIVGLGAYANKDKFKK